MHDVRALEAHVLRALLHVPALQAESPQPMVQVLCKTAGLQPEACVWVALCNPARSPPTFFVNYHTTQRSRFGTTGGRVWAATDRLPTRVERGQRG